MYHKGTSAREVPPTEKDPSLEAVVQALGQLSPGDLRVVGDAVAALHKAPIDSHLFLVDFWGIKLERNEAGDWVGTMPITPQILNPLQIVHGGASYTLADTVMGWAVWQQYEARKAVVTVEIKMTYLAPGRGKELRAETKILRAGATLAYTECRIQDERGRLVAAATGTYYSWDPSAALPD